MLNNYFKYIFMFILILPSCHEDIDLNSPVTSAINCAESPNELEGTLLKEATRKAFYTALDFRLNKNYSDQELEAVLRNYLMFEGIPNDEINQTFAALHNMDLTNSTINIDESLTLKFKSDLEEFQYIILNEQPNLEFSKQFWASKRLDYQIYPSVCQFDKQFLETVTYTIEGFIEFYYSFQIEDSGSRFCNSFWENFNCAFQSVFGLENAWGNNISYVGLSLFVTATVFAPVLGVIFSPVIFVAIFVIADNNLDEYMECCPLDLPFFEDQECGSAGFIIPIMEDCSLDNIEIKVIGSAASTAIWNWEIENGTPQNLTTNVPRINVSINQSNIPLTINVIPVCTNTVSADPITATFTAQELTAHANPKWSEEPPYSIDIQSSHTASIKTNEYHSNITWSVSGSAHIQNISPNSESASIFYYGLGDSEVKVSIVDICTNNTMEITKTVIVQ